MKLVKFDQEFIDKCVLWYKDKDVADAVGLWNKEYTDDEIKKIIVDGLSDKSNVFFGIKTYKDEAIGFVALKKIDWINKSAELHLCIGEKSVQGKGYSYLAARQLLKFVFKNYDFNRITTFSVESKGTIDKLLEEHKPFGFKFEGELRESIKIGDKFYNMKIYGLLRNDFFKEMRICRL